MEFITIFTGNDRTEISIITDLFRNNSIEHKVLDDPSLNSGTGEVSPENPIRVQVPRDEVDHAKAVLLENGFLGDWQKGRLKKESAGGYSKLVLIFLAALVLIIVSFLIMWFMNP